MSWTQPLCGQCWYAEHGTSRQPSRLMNPEVEVCCMCGQETVAGIYIRRDPKECYFPS